MIIFKYHPSKIDPCTQIDGSKAEPLSTSSYSSCACRHAAVHKASKVLYPLRLSLLVHAALHKASKVLRHTLSETDNVHKAGCTIRSPT